MRPAVLAVFLLAALASPSASQSAVPKAELKPVPMAQRLLVPVGQLFRVDEGVFDLRIGQTIDLTNRKLLLSMQIYNKSCCNMTINGERVSRWQVGSRIDLKRFRGTKEAVQDRDQCFLDVVDLVLPKGAPGVATFRLHCI